MPAINLKSLRLYTSSKVLVCPKEDILKAFANIRKSFPESFLFECTDKAGGGEVAVIGADPMIGIELTDLKKGFIHLPDKTILPLELQGSSRPDLNVLHSFYNDLEEMAAGSEHQYNGLYGYCSYNAVQLAENITFKQFDTDSSEIPLLKFDVYRYLLIFNPQSNEATLLYNSTGPSDTNWFEEIEAALFAPDINSGEGFFDLRGNATPDMEPEEFKSKTSEAIAHCLRGNVFQLVLSRRFESEFTGNLLSVFEELRLSNPSPYQFFFAYAGFALAGTSPEAQFKIKDGVAVINPIAGTYRRTGKLDADNQLAAQLLADPKENSEHIMLVDLARNDLSKFADDVRVTSFKRIEFYSQVIHIVSEVKGSVSNSYQPFELLLSNLPAGTLSGAPKYKAMQLIDELENSSRSFYGGCIGHISFRKEINTAILIRSVLAKSDKLYFRAGAGIVESSLPESELKEIDNKLRALRKALEKQLIPS